MSKNHRLAVAVVAALLLVALGGCSTFELDQGVQVEASPAALEDAVARTSGAGSGAYDAVYSYAVRPPTSPLGRIEVGVEGRWDGEGRMAAELDPDSLDGIGSGATEDLLVVVDPSAGVMRYRPELEDVWEGVALDQVPPAPGGVRLAAVSVPRWLQMLGAGADAVAGGGQADVRGVETAVLTRETTVGALVRDEEDAAVLRSVIGVSDLTPLAESAVEVEVFVDDQRTVRRAIATIDVLPVLVAQGDTELQEASERVQVDLVQLGGVEPIELPEVGPAA